MTCSRVSRQEMLIPLAVFVVPESGCKQAYLMSQVVIDIEPEDPLGAAEAMWKLQ